MVTGDDVTDVGVRLLSSLERRDEIDDDDDTEPRSGAVYTSMLVDDSNSTGPEIFPRRIDPAEYLIDGSRVDISGRLLRLVNALVIVAAILRVELEVDNICLVPSVFDSR